MTKKRVAEAGNLTSVSELNRLAQKAGTLTFPFSGFKTRNASAVTRILQEFRDWWSFKIILIILYFHRTKGIWLFLKGLNHALLKLFSGDGHFDSLRSQLFRFNFRLSILDSLQRVFCGPLFYHNARKCVVDSGEALAWEGWEHMDWSLYSTCWSSHWTWFTLHPDQRLNQHLRLRL